jgi:alkylhydroperoxidase family enzyme
MSKLRPLEKDELDEELKAICAEVERQSGSSASTRVLAHHPHLVKALRTFRGKLATEGVLDASLKELVRLKIARLNACQY